MRCEEAPNFHHDQVVRINDAKEYNKNSVTQTYRSDQLLLNKLVPKSNFEFQQESNSFDLENFNNTALKSVVWPWTECKIIILFLKF